MASTAEQAVIRLNKCGNVLIKMHKNAFGRQAPPRAAENLERFFRLPSREGSRFAARVRAYTNYTSNKLCTLCNFYAMC